MNFVSSSVVWKSKFQDISTAFHTLLNISNKATKTFGKSTYNLFAFGL